MTPRFRSIFALAAVAALALGGCSSDSEDTTGGAGSGGEDVAEDTVLVDNSTIAALTGETIEPGSLARPSLAAKIDNHPSARPQVGLDEADIVFEELVEGGYTRYLAVWHSRLPADIGPVRSVRPMDPEIVSPFGGIFAYSGGVTQFIQMMQAAPVYNAIHGQADTAETFYRTSAKVAPHNVLVKAPELVFEHLDKAAPPKMFDYATSLAQSTAVLSGEPVSAINTEFSKDFSPNWEWDGVSNSFLRFQKTGSIYVADTASSGKQLAATNVIVLWVQVDLVEGIPTTRLVSQGKGYVATGGSVVEVNWMKATAESPIVLTTASGETVLLGVGNTWIELLPKKNPGWDSPGILTIR